MEPVRADSPPLACKKRHSGSPVPVDPVEHILSDKWLCELFHEWAVENLCSENLLFYEEVDKFKAIENPDVMKSEAARIFGRYVQSGAIAEVNLDHECRTAISEQIETPSAGLFDEARQSVADMIKYDLYLKFVDSNIYRDYKGFPSTKRLPNPRHRNFRLAEVQHVTYDQITNLQTCLNNPISRDEFLKFTYNEFSDSVVQFYLDIDKFEAAPSLEFASKIFNKYLGLNPEEEVDVDPKMKRYIGDQIESGICHNKLFHTLKIALYAVMVQDNFLRFQNHVISSLALV